MRVPATALILFSLAAPMVRAGDVPKAMAILEVSAPMRPGQVPDASPARFVLMETGQVYVGGTSDIAVGQLSSSEQKALEKRLTDLRKLSGIAGTVTFGPGARTAH